MYTRRLIRAKEEGRLHPPLIQMVGVRRGKWNRARPTRPLAFGVRTLGCQHTIFGAPGKPGSVRPTHIASPSWPLARGRTDESFDFLERFAWLKYPQDEEIGLLRKMPGVPGRSMSTSCAARVLPGHESQ